MEELKKVSKNLVEEVLKLMNDAMKQMSLIRSNEQDFRFSRTT